DEKENFHLPGLWFNTTELQTLLLIRQLLEQVQPGLLGDYFQALSDRVNKLLSAMGKSADNIAEKIQIMPVAHQHVSANIFVILSQAILQNKVIRLQYCKINGEHSERSISPQRLIYYRDHWYLDAWCHLRQSLRTF